MTGPQSKQRSTSTIIHTRLALKLFRREPAISKFVWNFTATHNSSPQFLTYVGSVLQHVLPRLQPGHGQVTWFRVYVMILSRPIQTRFRSGSVFSDLTSHHNVTRRFILQKARHHTLMCFDYLQAHGFRFSFTPLPGFFSPFPHGTGSLSVTSQYLALRDGPRGFNRNFSCSDLLRILLSLLEISPTGLSPSLAYFSK